MSAKKVNAMSRLLAKMTRGMCTGSLASVSVPREWLEFVLDNKLTGKQIREIALAFIKKFADYVPTTFSLADIQAGNANAKDELTSLMAQTANNYEKGDGYE